MRLSWLEHYPVHQEPRVWFLVLAHSQVAVLIPVGVYTGGYKLMFLSSLFFFPFLFISNQLEHILKIDNFFKKVKTTTPRYYFLPTWLAKVSSLTIYALLTRGVEKQSFLYIASESAKQYNLMQGNSLLVREMMYLLTFISIHLPIHLFPHSNVSDSNSL